VPAALSPEVKRPEREADYSLPSIAKSKSVWSLHHCPFHMHSWQDKGYIFHFRYRIHFSASDAKETGSRNTIQRSP